MAEPLDPVTSLEVEINRRQAKNTTPGPDDDFRQELQSLASQASGDTSNPWTSKILPTINEYKVPIAGIVGGLMGGPLGAFAGAASAKAGDQLGGKWQALAQGKPAPANETELPFGIGGKFTGAAADIVDPLKQGAYQGVLDALGRLPGGVASYLTGKLGKAGGWAQALYESALNPSAKLAAKGVGETGFKEGIGLGGDVVGRARSIIEPINKAIDKIGEKHVGKVLNRNEIIARTEEEMLKRFNAGDSRLSGYTESGFRQAMKQITGGFDEAGNVLESPTKNTLAEHEYAIPFQKARHVATLMQKGLESKYGELGNAAIETGKTAARVIRKMQDEIAGGELAPLNERIHSLIDFEHAAKALTSRGQGMTAAESIARRMVAGAATGAITGGISHYGDTGSGSSLGKYGPAVVGAATGALAGSAGAQARVALLAKMLGKYSIPSIAAKGFAAQLGVGLPTPPPFQPQSGTIGNIWDNIDPRLK